MQLVLVLSLLFAGILASPGQGNSQGVQGEYGQARGLSGGAGGQSGAWGNRGLGGSQQGGSWGGKQQGGQAGWGQGRSLNGGQQGGWGQQGGAGGWGNGRSADGGQYGATIIDTPEMYGYEANIPGARSRFLGYRGAKSGGQQGAWARTQGQPRSEGQGYEQRGWSQGAQH